LPSCTNFLILVVFAALILSCNAATTHTISTSGFTWSPNTLTIAIGDSIQFTNLAVNGHVPAALKAGFSCDPSNVDTTLWTPPSGGNTFTAGPFNSAMTFNFKCIPHCSLGMTGTITVGSSTTTTTTTTKAGTTTTTTTKAGTTTTTKAGTSTSTPTTTTKTRTSSTTKPGTGTGTGQGNGGGCFAADSLVRILSSGDVPVEKLLQQVTRGDLVESFDTNGNPTFSRVYYVSHRNSVAQVPLVELSLSSGNNTAHILKLTENHLVLAASSFSSTSGQYVTAGSLNEGDFVFVRDLESAQLKPLRIQKINQAQGAIRTALTENDNIVVSNVAASVFVESVWFYRLLVAPLKFIDHYFPSLLEENSFVSLIVDRLVDITDYAEAHFAETKYAPLSVAFAASN